MPAILDIVEWHNKKIVYFVIKAQNLVYVFRNVLYVSRFGYWAIKICLWGHVGGHFKMVLISPFLSCVFMNILCFKSYPYAYHILFMCGSKAALVGGICFTSVLLAKSCCRAFLMYWSCHTIG